MVKGKPAGLDVQHTKMYANCSEEKPTRAMIYCHQGTKLAPCPELTGRDVACGLWDIGMPNLQQIMLVSLYWDGKGDPSGLKNSDTFGGERSPLPSHSTYRLTQ